MKNVATLSVAVILCVLLACPNVLAATLSERDVDDAMIRGYTEIKAKDFDTAKTTFAEIVRDAARSRRAPEAMLVLGALQFKSDRATGVNTYRALVQAYPDSSQAATALYRIGSEELRTKLYTDAQDSFRAAAANPTFSNLNRGRSLLQVGFLDMMKYFADQYWDRAEDGSPILVRPDLTGDRDQYLQSAREHFEVMRQTYAGSKNPEIAAVADAAIGEIYLLTEEPILAEEAYRRVLLDYGPMADKLANLAEYGLGQAFYAQEDLGRAVEQFDKALDGFTAGGLYGFGIARKKAKADMYSWKVLSLYGLKRFDEALVTARAARTELEKDTELARYIPGMDLWEGVLLCELGMETQGLSLLRAIIIEHAGTPYADKAASVISRFEGGD